MTKRNIKIAFIAVICILVIIFFSLNAKSTTLNLFWLGKIQMPLFVLLFIALIAGGGLTLMIEHVLIPRRKK